jgi:NAD(P)-dependent dehydrogenase (short-subunit alcohol dehydrogenase family)
MTQINGSICIVTGAASGIGQELALQAATRGASRIIATDVDEDRLESTVRLAGERGFVVEPAVFDVGSPEQVDNFISNTLPTLGESRLILFNNAGIALCAGRFQDTPIEECLRLLDINLHGVLRMTKGFYSHLLRTNQGHVVNLSSVFGLAGVDGNVAYCTSKFAVRGFTEALRMELINHRVRVTCVHPGGIKTNIVRNSKPIGPVMDQEKYQTLINDFERIAKTSAGQAARAILNSVEKNRSRLVIGWDGRQLDWMTRIFPSLYTQIIARQFRRKMGNPYES